LGSGFFSSFLAGAAEPTETLDKPLLMTWVKGEIHRQQFCPWGSRGRQWLGPNRRACLWHWGWRWLTPWLLKLRDTGGLAWEASESDCWGVLHSVWW
jgi:hypothetical protein